MVHFDDAVQSSMLAKFYRATTFDVAEMTAIASGMDRLLDALAGPDVFQNSRPAMRGLCMSLVSDQMEPKHVCWMPPPLECEWGGSWYVGPLPVDEASVLDFCREYGFNDFAKDFVVTPTVLAVSILTRAMLEYDDLAAELRGFETSLKAGLAFVAAALKVSKGRTGLLALSRLRSGGVPDYIAAHPEFSPVMHAKLIEVVATVCSTGVEPSVAAEICAILDQF